MTEEVPSEQRLRGGTLVPRQAPHGVQWAALRGRGHSKAPSGMAGGGEADARAGVGGSKPLCLTCGLPLGQHRGWTNTEVPQLEPGGPHSSEMTQNTCQEQYRCYSSRIEHVTHSNSIFRFRDARSYREVF